MLKTCCAKCKEPFEDGGQICSTPIGLVHPACVKEVAASVQEWMRAAMKEGLAEEKAAYAPDPKDVRRRLLREKLGEACRMAEVLGDMLDHEGREDPCYSKLLSEYRDEQKRVRALRAELLAIEDDHE